MCRDHPWWATSHLIIAEMMFVGPCADERGEILPLVLRLGGESGVRQLPTAPPELPSLAITAAVREPLFYRFGTDSNGLQIGSAIGIRRSCVFVSFGNRG